MSTIKVEVQLSSEELLKAVEQLDLSELEQFVSKVIVLQAQRKATRLTKAEAELLVKINQGLPSILQKDYEELMTKREAETLTDDEYKTLLSLTEEIEKMQAERIENLAELARIRNVSLATLMESLDIHATKNV
ncbi:MAG: STAS/SEC14 domain-containing protein [Scytonema sp. PMC 1069.18]|nr:STAS/SEC14 domain-containing protein [Scytonema sp. PMC 1069.18]MEC4886082.1 STAS/SEC14 domain-containing protein [Scytonema sp. PMC 1070.18]